MLQLKCADHWLHYQTVLRGHAKLPRVKQWRNFNQGSYHKTLVSALNLLQHIHLPPFPVVTLPFTGQMLLCIRSLPPWPEIYLSHISSSGVNTVVYPLPGEFWCPSCLSCGLAVRHTEVSQQVSWGWWGWYGPWGPWPQKPLGLWPCCWMHGEWHPPHAGVWLPAGFRHPQTVAHTLPANANTDKSRTFKRDILSFSGSWFHFGFPTRKDLNALVLKTHFSFVSQLSSTAALYSPSVLDPVSLMPLSQIPEIPWLVSSHVPCHHHKQQQSSFSKWILTCQTNR